MRARLYLPDSQPHRTSETTVELPRMRVNVSALWDFADELQVLTGLPTLRVTDSQHRLIKRGEEGTLSSEHLGYVRISLGVQWVPQPVRPDAPEGGYWAAGDPAQTPQVLANAVLATDAPSVVRSWGAVEQVRELAPKIDAAVDRLVTDSSYRLGLWPAIALGWAAMTAVVISGVIYASTLATRSGVAWLIAPAAVITATTIAAVTGWARRLLHIDLDRRKGVLIDATPRDKVRYDRENRRQNAKWAVIGSLIGGTVLFLIQESLKRLL